jgi:Na+/melibiose symporter-like transporter
MKDIYRADAKIGGFIGAMLLSGVAMGLLKGVQDNYFAEIVRIDAFERGIVEFFREIPGFLVIFFLAWMYRFTDNKIFKIGISLMAAGLIGFMLIQPGKIAVVAFLVLYSCGEHITMPVRSTISLDLARRDKGGASLGITSALSHGGNIAGFVMVSAAFFIFSRTGMDKLFQFRTVFAAAAALMIASLLVSLAMRDSGQKAPRRR